MKVAIDIRCLAESIHSGVQEYTINLLLSIFENAEDTEKFILFSAGRKFKIASKKFLEVVTTKKNVTRKHLPLPSKLVNLSFFLLRRVPLENFLGNPDVFFAPNINFYPDFKNTKLVVTIHDLSFHFFPNFFSFDRRRWHKLVAPAKIAKKADRIIAASHSTKWDLEGEYLLPPEKIEVIYSGVSDCFKKNSAISSSKVKAKYNLPPDFILYLGTIEPRKNLLGVVRAFELLFNSIKEHLVVVGPKGWHYKGALERINSSPARDRIHVIGPCQSEERPSLYKEASVFIYPSFFEGFGFPPLEAMATGTPAIVSSLSSFPEIVGNQAVMVDPRRSREVSEALFQILTDRGFRRHLKERFRDGYKKYTWRKAGEQTLNLFRSIS